MRSAARLLLLGAMTVLLTSCAGADKKREEGRQVFADAGCGRCHTLADAGTGGKEGPDLDRLKPSGSRTVRQVKHGGNGMPPFEGRLSEEEIGAVAQYVDGVAGRDAPVTAAFEPDGTTLDECRTEATLTCYEQAFGNLVVREGPERALATLEETERTPPAGFSCHRVTHTMGAAALVRFKGSVAKAFVD